MEKIWFPNFEYIFEGLNKNFICNKTNTTVNSKAFIIKRGDWVSIKKNENKKLIKLIQKTIS